MAIELKNKEYIKSLNFGTLKLTQKWSEYVDWEFQSTVLDKKGSTLNIKSEFNVLNYYPVKLNKKSPKFEGLSNYKIKKIEDELNNGTKFLFSKENIVKAEWWRGFPVFTGFDLDWSNVKLTDVKQEIIDFFNGESKWDKSCN